MSFDATQRIRPARQTLEDAYDVPGNEFYNTALMLFDPILEYNPSQWKSWYKPSQKQELSQKLAKNGQITAKFDFNP